MSVTPPGSRQSPQPPSTQDFAAKSQSNLSSPLGLVDKPLTSTENLTFTAKPVDIKTSEPKGAIKKTSDYVRNLFWKVKQNYVVPAAQKALHGIDWCVFKGDVKASCQESLAELHRITGTDKFGEFVSRLTLTVFTNLKNKYLHEGFINDVVSSEADFFKVLFQLMITKMMVNTGHDLQAKQANGEAPGATKHVSAVDIMAHVMDVLTKKLEEIEEDLAHAEAIEDPDRRRHEIENAIAPLVEEVLRVGFPKGSDELPFRSAIRGIAWNWPVRWLASFAMRDLASYTRGLQGRTNIVRLQDNPSEAFLGQVAKQANKAVVAWGKEFIVDPAITRLLTEKAINKLTLTTSEENESLQAWVQSQIIEFGQSTNPKIKMLWKFFGGSIEACLAHVFVNMSSASGQSSEATAAIGLKIMEKISAFVDKNSKKISEKEQVLTTTGKNPIEDKDFQKLFLPLAHEIQQMMALKTQEGVLPGFLNNTLEKVFEELLPNLFAENYHRLLVPIAECYKNYKETSGVVPSENMDQTDQQGIKLVAGVIDYLKSNGTKLAGDATAKLAEQVPNLKEYLRKFTLKKLGNTADEVESKAEADNIEQLEKWCNEWLESKILSLGNSSDSGIDNFWRFIRVNIQNQLKYVTGSDHTQYLNVAMERVLGAIKSFKEMHGNALYEQYHELLKRGKVPESESEFIAAFTPLSNDLLLILGMNADGKSPLPALVVRVLQPLISKKLPELMARNFRELIKLHDMIPTYRNRMQQLFAKSDAETSAVYAQQFENMCSIVAGKLSLAIGGAVNKQLIRKTELSPIPLEQLQSVNELYLNEGLKAVLMQGITHYLEANSEAGNASMSSVLHRLGNVVGTHLKADATAVKQALAIADPQERAVALRAIFIPVSKELLSMLRAPGTLQSVPIALPFASLVESHWNVLEEKIFPDVLVEMFLDTSSLQREVEKQREEIKEKTKSNYIPEACRFFAQMLSKQLPTLFSRDPKALAEPIVDGLRKFLATTNSAESVESFLAEHDVFLKQQIFSLVFGIFNKDDGIRDIFQPYAADYLESLLLKACNSLTTKIANVEKNQSEFLVKLGIRLLTHINDHFNALNQVTKEKGKSASHEVRTTEYIDGFKKKGALHTAYPQSEAAKKAHKKIKQTLSALEKLRKEYASNSDPESRAQIMLKIRATQVELYSAKQVAKQERAGFFKPLAADLNELMGLGSADQVPAPAFLKEPLWKLFQEELLPTFLNSLSDIVLESNTRNLMMIKGLETLRAAQDAEDQVEKEFNESYKLVNNAYGKITASITIVEKTDPPNLALLNALKTSRKILKASKQALNPLSYNQIIKQYLECSAVIDEHLVRVNEQLGPYFTPDAGIEGERLNKYLNGAATDLAAASSILRKLFEQLKAEDEIDKKEDQTQRDLTKSSGELVFQMLKLIPHSVLKIFFKADWIKNLTAEKIGRTLRKQLGNKWTFMDLLVQGAQAGVSSLDPLGKWSDQDKADDALIAKFIGGGEGGESIFSFAETLDQMELTEIQKQAEVEKVAVKLRALMVTTARRTAVDTILAICKIPLVKLKQLWDWLVEKIFGKFAPEVRAFFHFLGVKWLYRFLEVMVAFSAALVGIATFPVSVPAYLLINWHLETQIDHVIKNLNLDIHENLLFKLFDEIIGWLKGEQIGADSLIAPLVQAVDIKSEESRADALKRAQQLRDQLLAILVTPIQNPIA